jgi:hypothetical protein
VPSWNYSAQKRLDPSGPTVLPDLYCRDPPMTATIPWISNLAKPLDEPHITDIMPKAEVGSTKYLNNKLKSKGLQRLRWYCQVCERRMRDENGFKMHTNSESHVRQMLLVGEDPKKYINDYSNQFQRDFLQLLRPHMERNRCR